MSLLQHLRNGLADVQVGQREEAEQRGGAGVGREALAGVELAGEGIGEGGGLLREVAGALLRGGHDVLHDARGGVAQAFIVGEEEGAVCGRCRQCGMSTRPAEGGAEVVGDFLGLVGGVGAVGDGVEAGVLEEPVGGAVGLVGAGLGDGGDLAGLAVLGVVVDAVYADFADGLGGGKASPRMLLEVWFWAEMPSTVVSDWLGRPPWMENLMAGLGLAEGCGG